MGTLGWDYQAGHKLRLQWATFELNRGHFLGWLDPSREFLTISILYFIVPPAQLAWFLFDLCERNTWPWKNMLPIHSDERPCLVFYAKDQ
jgi:hypothetical protein